MAKVKLVTFWNKFLGRKIRKIRLENKKTIEDIAFDANIGFSYLAKIERGEVNTTVSTLCQIAKALNVSPKDLF